MKFYQTVSCTFWLIVRFAPSIQNLESPFDIVDITVPYIILNDILLFYNLLTKLLLLWTLRWASAERKRKIYDTRSTLHKSSYSSNSSSYSSSGSYGSSNGYRYRTTGAKDYDDYIPSYGSSKRGNRYQTFTFRNLFESTPFHKLFGKQAKLFAFPHKRRNKQFIH